MRQQKHLFVLFKTFKLALKCQTAVSSCQEKNASLLSFVTCLIHRYIRLGMNHIFETLFFTRYRALIHSRMWFYPPEIRLLLLHDSTWLINLSSFLVFTGQCDTSDSPASVPRLTYLLLLLVSEQLHTMTLHLPPSLSSYLSFHQHRKKPAIAPPFLNPPAPSFGADAPPSIQFPCLYRAV